MIVFALSFLLGDLLLQAQRVLPEILIVAGAGILGLIIIYFGYQQKIMILILSGILLGFCFTGWFAISITKWQLPIAWEGKQIALIGIVSSIPTDDQYGKHFIVDTKEIKLENITLPGRAKVRVNSPSSLDIHTGDEARFFVKMKQIHGLRNPGGFDYETWALANQLRATGSIIHSLPVEKIRHHYFYAMTNQLREYFQKKLLLSLPLTDNAPWLLALTIGERGNTKQQHWAILRATGTNHLMAIAGLHIGLAAGFIHVLIFNFWRMSTRLTRIFPAQKIAELAALITAWSYSALAGFSIPTQRACIMLTIFIMTRLLFIQPPAWHVWSSALLIVLLINPLAVLTESFWLSFGTIALIIYGMQARLHPHGLWWKWGRVQWVIGFGLIPISLYFFQQASLISVVANSIAIPWLGFLILPFCMFGIIFIVIYPPFAALSFWVADKSLTGLWLFLEWLSRLDHAVWTHTIHTNWLLLCITISSLLLLLPRGIPGRWLGLFWLLPVLMIHPDKLNHGDFQMVVLDVGQGLAVVVTTRNHALIFDAGPKSGNQFDAGENVVVPYLYSADIKHIDSMIISHGDNDHVGGAESILRLLPVAQVLTSNVDKIPEKYHPQICVAGMNWEWDGVLFTMLYPDTESLRLGNDSSCVLRIQNRKYSALLTGDIEKFAENRLLHVLRANLHANVMTAPHHGSKTSSQKEFIHTVDPEYVIFATGYRNRYHFPHASVIDHYQEKNVLMLNTMETGAIRIMMKNNSNKISPMLYRYDHNHYW